MLVMFCSFTGFISCCLVVLISEKRLSCVFGGFSENDLLFFRLPLVPAPEESLPQPGDPAEHEDVARCSDANGSSTFSVGKTSRSKLILRYL